MRQIHFYAGNYLRVNHKKSGEIIVAVSINRLRGGMVHVFWTWFPPFPPAASTRNEKTAPSNPFRFNDAVSVLNGLCRNRSSLFNGRRQRLVLCRGLFGIVFVLSLAGLWGRRRDRSRGDFHARSAFRGPPGQLFISEAADFHFHAFRGSGIHRVRRQLLSEFGVAEDNPFCDFGISRSERLVFNGGQERGELSPL